MPTKEDLILEKRRYGLDQTVSTFELEQLKQQMPIQKIIGYIEMADVNIDLSYNVLIPRYETEELIYWVKEEIHKINKKDFKILDLCTGSGFIGLALKKNFPHFEVTLSDISSQAIKQTKLNAQRNNLDVMIIQSNLFENLKTNNYDLIVANPPYLQSSEILSDSVLNFEPSSALFAPDDGFYFYKEIIKEAPKYLKNGHGLLFFEINPFHLEIWKKLSQKLDIEIQNDISNKPRMVKIRF
ncbi:peptide chain release factor N(5)-glutamine methyltransferase [Mycoplasmopsis gallopavonis]|uniref:peptide chain release factor N(5)-glutamine methyltransferase n=1 Tax=Mycoplasmopsis gallopavonis TaxID=76629 RepID=A0A449B049_9BACT|nr:peptide chain release factor N(5)-glutamine methyltransferase [Mycoplasmopsis gallopavonis]RIV16347.1 peptide chain release factor N(5)-glutamine methyltransferase [Mycoplasmopsis gallopavonis]VEU73129.1 protoporphyrinogen oxidase [Mycoplasmopsis gallopavonis]